MKIRLFDNHTKQLVGALDLEFAPQKDNFISIAGKNYQVTDVRIKGDTAVDLAVSPVVNLPLVFQGH